MLIRSFNSTMFTQDGALRVISEVDFLAIFGWHREEFMMSTTDSALTVEMDGDVENKRPTSQPWPPHPSLDFLVS